MRRTHLAYSLIARSGSQAAGLVNPRPQPVYHRRDWIVRNATHEEDHEGSFAGTVSTQRDAHTLHSSRSHQPIDALCMHFTSSGEFRVCRALMLDAGRADCSSVVLSAAESTACSGEFSTSMMRVLTPSTCSGRSLPPTPLLTKSRIADSPAESRLAPTPRACTAGCESNSELCRSRVFVARCNCSGEGVTFRSASRSAATRACAPGNLQAATECGFAVPTTKGRSPLDGSASALKTSEMILPSVSVSEEARSNATGSAVSRVTIREPESPSALKVPS